MTQRMVHGVSKRMSLSLLPLLAATAFAQDVLEEDELPEIRRYTVEMIIFAYQQNVATGSEIFVADEAPPVASLLDGAIIDGQMTPALSSVPTVVAPQPRGAFAGNKKKYQLVMLAERDFTLRNAYARLDNLDAYKPLLHFGWTQPTYPEEVTETRPLSSFVTPPEGLAGDLTLYLSRYLHLAVNLQLDAPVDAMSNPVQYRINEDRIFRNGELRYFDHPKFGILAKITRVEDEEPEEELLPGESEFLGFDGQ